MQQTSLFEVSMALVIVMLGLVFMLVQLPESIMVYKPSLVVLILYYACLYMPDRVNIWVAWIIGLLVDSLDGFILGNHALQFAFLATFGIIFQTKIKMYSVSKQALILLFIYGLMLSFEFALRYIVEETLAYWLFWVPAITTAIVWPLFYLFLSSLRRKIYN